MEREIEELIRVQELLRLEKEDDYQQYRESVLKASINQRKNNGLTWYPVVINSTEVGIGEYLILDIERTSDHNLPHQFSSGKSVALFSNADPGDNYPTVNGVVKSVSGNKLRLALMVDELPDWVDDGKLGLNLLFDESSYREMEIAMHMVINAQKGRLAHLRSIMYGSKEAQFEKRDKSIAYPELNESQNEAVRNIAASRDVAIIHGPPGTGKTTTLVEAIRHTLLAEDQVLVCSPSNVAVDLITEKLVRKGLNVLRLGNPARVSEEVMTNTLDARIVSHPYYKDVKNFIRRAEEFRKLAQKYKRNFGKAEREQRQLLFSEAKSIMKEARQIEDHILDEQFSKAQVITCTPVNAAGRYLKDRNFKTVFIDEAAQALEPMTWIVIGKAERVVFAGDHLQLPPTVKSKRAEAGGLRTTLFEKCILNQQASVMLDTQYRMHEKIMEFPNTQFYGGRLKAHTSVAHRVLREESEDPLLNRPVEFIDTAGCGFDEELNNETQSLSNSNEAGVLIKHLKQLLAACNRENIRGFNIGVISPYKEQVQLLDRLISEDEELEAFRRKIAVKTIDGFQGQEKDIIYISLVRSNESGDIGFLNDHRRMNVALTRAKKKLVVLGDSATLSYHNFYKEFLDHTEKQALYRSAWEFSE